MREKPRVRHCVFVYVCRFRLYFVDLHKVFRQLVIILLTDFITLFSFYGYDRTWDLLNTSPVR
jgi:hypothetical protein